MFKNQSHRRRASMFEALEPRTLFSGFPYPGSGTTPTETASATVAMIASTGSGASKVYNYSVTLNNSGAASLGTFWFGWTPGENFMTSSPTSVSSPTGWTDTVVHGGSGDGYSIQWVANGTSLTAGQSLTGFTFSSTDSPTALADNSTFHPGTAVETSFVYGGAPLSDSGDEFIAAAPTTPVTPVTPVVIPPTASVAVALQSATGTGANKIYNYDLTVTNTSATTIGTFWFAWIPHEDFLHTIPTAVSSPTGWNDTITNDSAKDGFGIQWVAGTAASPDAAADIPAGQSLSGFKFSTHDSPAALTGKSTFFSKSKVETSFVYSGAPFSDAGTEFIAARPTVPLANSLLAKLPSTPTLSVTTIPANGDVNPYGVAIVPNNFATGGSINGGDVLVSNFNNATGLQGTGTTIVSISPTGQQMTFFQGQAGLGLTTALGVLRRGFVLVGNTPAPDGATVQGPGSLLILDKNGNVVDTLSDPTLLDGPWDLTVQDNTSTANVFVSNVLNGTVTRLKLSIPRTGDNITVVSEMQIATGYAFRTDPAALVVGPTGLALSPNGTLYVASTGDNAVYAIPAAVNRRTAVSLGRLVLQNNSELRGPLALAFDGANLVLANGDAVNADSTGEENSELIEFTPTGKFVDMFQVNATIGGAFGLAFAQSHGEKTFAAIDDVTNTLDEWILK